MDKYEVGQSVTIHDHYYGPTKITVVEKVTHNGKRVVTADGGEWKMPWGDRWGHKQRFYTGPRIRATSPGDRDAIERKILVAKISDFGEWVDRHRRVNKDLPCPTEALRAVVAAMNDLRQPAAAESTVSADSKGDGH